MSEWAASTLAELDALRHKQLAAHAAAETTFERLHELAREILAARGCHGLAVAPSGQVYGLARRGRHSGAYFLHDLDADHVTLALVFPLHDDVPTADELGARCHAAWRAHNEAASVANAHDRELEAALRAALAPTMP